MGWPVQPSWVAGGDISPSVFVVIDPSADETVIEGGASPGQPTIGIMQQGMRDTPGLTGSNTDIAASSGDQNFHVFAIGDICPLVAGGTFNAGAELMVTTGGRGILATSGYYVGAIALQAGINDRVVNVMVVRYQKSGVGSSGV